MVRLRPGDCHRRTIRSHLRSVHADGQHVHAPGGHTASLLPNEVLIAGGDNCPHNMPTTNMAELYNPGTGTFTVTGSMSVPRTGQTATTLPNGKILIAGGHSCTVTCVYYYSAEIYDPSTGLFTPTGSLAAASQSPTAVLLQNGKVLFLDGLVGGAVASATRVYDPSSGTFSLTGSLNIPRDLVTATLLSNGNVLIVSGNSTLSLAGPAEIYNPSSRAFTVTGSLHEPRIGATGVLLSDDQYVAVREQSGSRQIARNIQAARMIPDDGHRPLRRQNCAAY